MTSSGRSAKRSSAARSPRVAGGARRGGLTLLETILAIGLLVVLAAVTYIAAASWPHSRDFDEGVDRFEAMLRLARADAALEGRRLRVDFEAAPGEQTAQILLLWEPAPLAEPGRFQEFTACLWRERIPSGLIRVIRCRRIGPSAYRPMSREDFGGALADAALEPITFYPDGSSDSIAAELAPPDPEATRRIVLRLDGVTGAIETWAVPADQADSYMTALVEGTDPEQIVE